MIIFVTKMFVEIERDGDTVVQLEAAQAEPPYATARTAITGSIRAIVSDYAWHCFERRSQFYRQHNLLLFLPFIQIPTNSLLLLKMYF